LAANSIIFSVQWESQSLQWFHFPLHFRCPLAAGQKRRDVMDPFRLHKIPKLISDSIAKNQSFLAFASIAFIQSSSPGTNNA
jgi:hypothetical protein